MDYMLYTGRVVINPLMSRISFTFLPLEMAAIHVFWQTTRSHSRVAKQTRKLEKHHTHNACVCACIWSAACTRCLCGRRTHAYVRMDPRNNQPSKERAAHVDFPPKETSRADESLVTERRRPQHIACNLETAVRHTHTHTLSTASPRRLSPAVMGGQKDSAERRESD